MTITTRASKPSRLRETRFYNDYDRYNYDDFQTQAEAQEFFEQYPNDIHNLDRDNDGIPCESLK